MNTTDFPFPKLPPYTVVEPIMMVAAKLVAALNIRYEPETIVSFLGSEETYLLEGYDQETGEAIIVPAIGDGFAEFVPAHVVFSIELVTQTTQSLVNRLN